MKFINTVLLIFLTNNLFTQVQFLSGGGNGDLILSTTTGCCERFLGNYISFIDIAVTPNGRIYGLAGNIYEIDTLSKAATFVSSPLNQNGIYSAGAGLVALDNNYLLSDKADSLYKIEISTGTSVNLGKIGYYCNGDFAFFNNDLYMSSQLNELIKISLDPNNQNIIDVVNLGVMSLTGNVYSLFTTFDGYNSDNKSLFAIKGSSVFKVNVLDASLQLICAFDFGHVSYGGASIYDFSDSDDIQKIPNVFTPNNDGINDLFQISNTSVSKFFIVNRWGNIVFNWEKGDIIWDGKNQNGMELSEGIYFYIKEFIDCKESKQVKGFITLLR